MSLLSIFRIMEKTESVNIFDAEKCRETYTHQHRQQMFFPKANICAGRTNFENIKIVRIYPKAF